MGHDLFFFFFFLLYIYDKNDSIIMKKEYKKNMAGAISFFLFFSPTGKYDVFLFSFKVAKHHER